MLMVMMYFAESMPPRKTRADEFLNSENDKSDYDWYLFKLKLHLFFFFFFFLQFFYVIEDLTSIGSQCQIACEIDQRKMRAESHLVMLVYSMFGKEKKLHF
jgi:hypothetical protein